MRLTSSHFIISSNFKSDSAINVLITVLYSSNFHWLPMDQYTVVCTESLFVFTRSRQLQIELPYFEDIYLEVKATVKSLI